VDLWVTRKGAIRAADGDRGVIPGSMGTDSYIVRGLGSAQSLESASHGAGRVMSRAEARTTFRSQDLREQMGGITWNESATRHLVDEAPGAYRDINKVMQRQKDLVAVEARLRQLVNLKGSDEQH
jgi:tRNA-splicing ligase RtcB